MRRNMKWTKRISSAMLSAVMVAGLFAGAVPTKKAEAGTNTGRALYEKIMAMGNTKPSDYSEDKDPYGHGNNQFMLATQEELFVLKSNGDSKDVKSYERLKKENEGNPLTSAPAKQYKDNDAAGTSKSLSGYKNDLSYVQTVSFSPDKDSVRKDHIAMIGINSNKKVCLEVIDKNGNSTNAIEIGEAKWMAQPNNVNHNNMYDFNSMNFLSITAGDYDCDGSDSIVVYACLDNNNYNLFEFVKNGNTYTAKSNGSTKPMLHNYFPEAYSYFLSQGGDQEHVGNKLHCDIDTGDINNDGIDDLVALSYVNRMDKKDGVTYKVEMRDRITDLYRPYLAVHYGKKGDSSNIVNAHSNEIGVWKEDLDDNDNFKGTYTSCLAPGLSVGDVDGDTKDDVVVSGFVNTIKGKSGEYIKDISDADPYLSIGNTRTKLLIAIYGKDLAEKKFDASQATNDWTLGGATEGGLFTADTSAGDVSWQRTAVETVAINGRGHSELIFINGYLYSYEGNTKAISEVYKSSYFNKSDTDVAGMQPEETYFRSVAVGCFDGNDYGREQIMYVIGAAQKSGAGKGKTIMGMMGGKYNNTDPYKATGYYSTTETQMDNVAYPSSISSMKYNDKVNCVLCAWDTNNDGLLAKYAGKDFIYTDPEVLAILQAPPFFRELDGTLTDTSGTSYTISSSYNYSTTKGNSVSFGLGVVGDVEAKCVKVEVEAGYATDWSETFEEGLTTTETLEFTTHKEDAVVITRTPVTIYKYNVMVDNQWDEKNQIELSFPGTPSKELINVADYNDFAKYYNEESQRLVNVENAKRATKNVAPITKVPKLELINDKWLGHEGDPMSYMTVGEASSDKKILMSSPSTFKLGSSTTGFSYETEESSTHEETSSHGFTFDLTLMFGAEVGGFAAFEGAHASLEYMHSSGTSTTKTKGEGTGCQLCNIDPDALEGAEIPKETAEQYEFSYQMISWPSNMKKTELQLDGKTTKEVPVPIFGYMLSNVRAAAPQVTDLKAAYGENKDGNSVIELTWSNPSKIINPVGSFVIYQYLKDGKLEKVAEVDSDVTKYTFTNLDGRNEYTFVVRSKSVLSHLEGVNSNKARVYNETSGICSIELTNSDSLKDTYTVKHLNGNTSEFYVHHKSVISIQKKTTLGDIDVFTVLYSDGTSSEIQVINKVTKGTTVIADDVKAQVTIKDTKPGETPTAVYNGSVEKNAKNIVVPETVSFAGMTYNVTQVANNAFKDNKKVESITIGNNISSIGDNAFLNCTNLKNVSISNKVKEIGDNTFKNCSKLKDVTIPDGVTEIGKNAFMGCTNLTKVSIPKTVTSIDNSTFMNCANLKSVTIPENVKEISNNTFMNCKKLTNVTLPQSLTSIGDNSFTNCTNLSKISIPRNVTKIGKKSFKNCSKLSKVNIGNNTKEIGSSAFANCKSLKSFTIPKNVSKLGNNILNGDYKIKLITIKTKKLNNKSVSKKAFDGISDEITVKVPKSKNKKYSKILVKSGLSKDATIK